jgi:hypothetical protein
MRTAPSRCRSTSPASPAGSTEPGRATAQDRGLVLGSRLFGRSGQLARVPQAPRGRTRSAVRAVPPGLPAPAARAARGRRVVTGDDGEPTMGVRRGPDWLELARIQRADAQRRNIRSCPGVPARDSRLQPARRPPGLKAFLASPLTDSNRRPPLYEGGRRSVRLVLSGAHLSIASWAGGSGWMGASLLVVHLLMGRQAARGSAAPAGAKGWSRVSMCQIASARRRARSTWATLAPRCLPSRCLVCW